VLVAPSPKSQRYVWMVRLGSWVVPAELNEIGLPARRLAEAAIWTIGTA
jgi:hypothetical protein